MDNTELAFIRSGFDGLNTRLDEVNGRLDGVNTRLDTVNGRIYNHEGRLSKAEGKLDDIEEAAKAAARVAEAAKLVQTVQVALNPKVKTAIAVAGAISVIAVLHSVFEMVSNIGPFIHVFGKLLGQP